MSKVQHHTEQKRRFLSARKHRQSWLRWLIGELHLWLGLASGIVVLIVCVSGCIFCFQTEISNVVYRKAFFVTPQQTATIPLSVLREKAQHALGAAKPIEGITTYREPDKAWEFMAYKENDSAVTYFGGLQYYESVFVNPYTGQITGRRDYKYDFLFIMKYVHWSLLLNTKYGQPIVGYSTLIFVILLITGLVLWWPRKWNKSTRERSFKIKFSAKFKRLNYDLHNVLGFYSLLIALVLALTGMVFAFQWFNNVVYAVAAGTTKAPEYVTKQSAIVPGVAENSGLDKALQNAFALAPDARRIGIGAAEAKEGVIYAYAYKDKENYYDRDDLQFDQYTGKLLYRRNRRERNAGEKLTEMNYDIHVGVVGGLAGKIIAFIACLICASLPVTGFLVWWHKRKKTKKPAKALDKTTSGTPAIVE
ncbi:PepSY-associated TM helix domain-containing protein [Deminuibacter soli]|uniref:PepSY domain-containing protein n=1 Tax=Deminuibacter soli TaxID=2291815 RepID=A0A3E1NPA8_9BACT|nr:PepSY-associated TM helix domain-containing protein [Deminuibacter soli]RFM29750.1 PepSY domain-containing protein [Deminuibacter soli]